jgi:hypothetical protein
MCKPTRPTYVHNSEPHKNCNQFDGKLRVELHRQPPSVGEIDGRYKCLGIHVNDAHRGVVSIAHAAGEQRCEKC